MPNAFYITCIDGHLWMNLRLCWTCCEPLKRPRQRYFCGEICVRVFDCNHYWTHAQEEALRRAEHRCRRCSEVAVEVNHIEPLRGRVRVSSCLNHQTNLEALCHACHLVVTGEQFGWRTHEQAQHGARQEALL